MPYLPPARITDFDRSPNSEVLYRRWHDRVASQIDSYRNYPRFLDPLDVGDDPQVDSIPWSGFPRIIDAWLDVENRPSQLDRAHRSAELLAQSIYARVEGEWTRLPANPENGLMLVPRRGGGLSFDDAFSLAYRPQDEYLEWHVVRDPESGSVLRIDFTAEAPEYWETLAEGDRGIVAELYSDLLRRNVPAEDLFFDGDTYGPDIVRRGNTWAIDGYIPLLGGESSDGQYNRANVWNTARGAVHLTHPANTLFAEINLAANATLRFAARPDLDTDIDRFALIACGGYGDINRNSDPTIGMAVNSFALSGFRAMVSNPIGLYVGGFDLGGFRDPDGNPVDQSAISTVHRGSFNDEDGLARVLRFSVHPPEGAGYTLDQCSLDGFALVTGGPIARNTTVIIHGVAAAADTENPIEGCGARACPHPTKSPRYYLTAEVEDVCLPPDHQAWTRAPVRIAPELTGPEIVAGPRVFGRR